MTYFYTYSSSVARPNQNNQMTDEAVKEQLEYISDKKNWRIVQLPNGFYQTEYKDMQNEKIWHDVTRRETLESAEAAIDGSLEHYNKKLSFLEGPRVVKTF